MSADAPRDGAPAWEPVIRIQAEAFDPGLEQQRLRAGRTDIGAVVSFEGICRDHAPGLAAGVQALELEHYPGMTERSIGEMVREARRRWPLQGATVIHRIGVLQPGDPIVLVVTASAHRRAAFEACEFLMDYLKTQAPLWKKESSGATAQWVDAREADDEALTRWGIVSDNSSKPAGAA